MLVTVPVPLINSDSGTRQFGHHRSRGRGRVSPAQPQGERAQGPENAGTCVFYDIFSHLFLEARGSISKS